jgi:hypothetical protein
VITMNGTSSRHFRPIPGDERTRLLLSDTLGGDGEGGQRQRA